MKTFNLPGGLWYTLISALTLLWVNYGPADDPWVPIVLGGLGLAAKVVAILTGTDIPAGVVPGGPEGTLSTPAPVKRPNAFLRSLFG